MEGRRFKRVGEPRHEGGSMIEEYVLELRPGHTVTRVDHTTTTGAGRKGRSAMVDVHRTLDCTCGGKLGMGGLSVREDLANLRHYETPEERDRAEREDAELRDHILRQMEGG